MTDKTVETVIWPTVLEFVAPDMPTHLDGGTVTAPSGFSGGYPDRFGATDFTLEWDIAFTPAQEDEWDEIQFAAYFVVAASMKDIVLTASKLADLHEIATFMEGTGGGVAEIRQVLRALLRLTLT